MEVFLEQVFFIKVMLFNEALMVSLYRYELQTKLSEKASQRCNYVVIFKVLDSMLTVILQDQNQMSKSFYVKVQYIK